MQECLNIYTDLNFDNVLFIAQFFYSRLSAEQAGIEAPQ